MIMMVKVVMIGIICLHLVVFIIVSIRLGSCTDLKQKHVYFIFCWHTFIICQSDQEHHLHFDAAAECKKIKRTIFENEMEFILYRSITL